MATASCDLVFELLKGSKAERQAAALARLRGRLVEWLSLKYAAHHNRTNHNKSNTNPLSPANQNLQHHGTFHDLSNLQMRSALD